MAKHIIVATDGRSGNEAMYVGGELKMEDTTVYACDIADEAGDDEIQFSHVNVYLEPGDEWPKEFGELIPKLDEE